MITIVLTALAGGVGAAARYALEVALTRRLRDGWIRLLVINVSGSALLGLVVGLAGRQLVPPDLQLVLGSGFLGGYTTFSAASLATVRLVEERRWPAVVLSSLGMVLAAVVAAAVGLAAGLAL